MPVFGENAENDLRPMSGTDKKISRLRDFHRGRACLVLYRNSLFSENLYHPAASTPFWDLNPRSKSSAGLQIP